MIDKVSANGAICVMDLDVLIRPKTYPPYTPLHNRVEFLVPDYIGLDKLVQVSLQQIHS
jgi:hypothetical protein